MSNARCCAPFSAVMLAASLLLGAEPAERQIKPLPVALGMTTAEVTAELGKPQEAASTPDGVTTWKYSEKATIVEVSFEGGRVVRIVQAVVGDDAKEIQGTWKMVSMAAEGKTDTGPDEIMVIGGGKITLYEGSESAETGQYRLDSTASPRTIDLVDADGQVAQGIYSLAGDDLKIWAAEPGVARPKQFESQAGANITVMVLKRQSRQWKHPSSPPNPNAKGAKANGEGRSS
jgi:uncharacterized protein (TIGR03067 family)